MHHYTLEGLGLVDSAPEPAFTNLVDLASHLIGTPVSLISFVQREKGRQYFKARVGLDIEQTPLSRSFCKHVVGTNAPLVVHSSLEDYRVWENPVIEELGVHAYLGMPVHDPNGEPVASLCVIDTETRQWSDNDQVTLKKLARCVTDAIRLKFELSEKERLRREQQDFAHAISHDLKGPLHTLGWVLEIVEECHSKDFEDSTRQLVEAGKNTVSRARQMVDDLLDLSEVDERRELEMAPVDLLEVFDEIKESLSADIARLDARIHVVEPVPTLLGARCQLDMLFQNLVTNALKFHRPGRPPRIRVSCEERDDAIEVTVSDNGIGISEEYRHKIFELFERTDRGSGYEGSGIGLSLVMRVVENHGGTIRIDSDGETGSSFVVRLPRRRLADREHAAIDQGHAAVSATSETTSPAEARPSGLPGGVNLKIA